jgi:DnaJ-like protein
MDVTASRYPLAWPMGWKRTRHHERKRAAFAKSSTSTNYNVNGHPTTRTSTRPLTVSDAIARLSGELSRLGAADEVLSTNVAVRLDGLPRSGQPEPDDPGAAVYFKLGKHDRCLACDRWDRVADNIAAIAQHIDALRRIDRYGVGTMEQAFAGYAALPPTAEDWWLVLEVPQNAHDVQIEEAYRRLIKVHHPDVGGTHDGMAKLNKAYAVAKAR